MTNLLTKPIPAKTDKTPAEYRQYFYRLIWFGTLGLHALLLAATATFWPELLKYAFAGVLMGLFNVWSLFRTVEHPRGGLQVVFSLIRIVVLAYLVVMIPQGRLPEFAIVIGGLLSYKVVLTAETLRQAAGLLRKKSKKPL